MWRWFFMAAVEAAQGVRLPGTWDGFEVAIRAIVSELQTESASEILAALTRAYGRRVPAPPSSGPDWLFPSPTALRSLDSGDLSSGAVERIRALAGAVLNGAIRFDPTSTYAQLVERLVWVGGLSASRAAWVAMRTLGEPDAPLLDGNASAVWRPWRSYVALVQLAGLDEISRGFRSAGRHDLKRVQHGS